MGRIRKTISAVLVSALLIGLIPTIASAQAETSPVYSYSFTIPAFNSSFADEYLLENNTIIMNTTVRAAMTFDMIERNSSAFWELEEYVPNNSSGRGTLYQERMLLHGDYVEGVYISFKIAVPRAGWYNASTVYDKGQYSGDMDVYLGDYSEDASAVMIPDNQIGSVDCYQSGGQYYGHVLNSGKLYFDEPGEYLLVYEMNKNDNTVPDSSNRIFMYLRSFTLSFLQYSNDTANYSFKSTAIGGTGTVYGLSNGYTDYSNIVPALSDNWAYAGRSSNLVTDLNSTTKYTIVQHKTTPLYWAALMIDVPKSGSYDVKLTTYQNNTTTIAYDVYVIPYTEDVTSAVNSLEPGSFVGSVDGNSESVGDKTDNVGAFNAQSAGDYIIIFKGTSSNPGYVSGNHYLYLISLELDGVANYIAPLPAAPDNEDRTNNEHSVMITAANSSAGATGVPVTITTNLDGYTQGTATNYGIGTNVTATAPAETGNGQRFKYWIHKGSKRVVATDTQVTFNLGSNTTLVAVYSDSGEGTLIEFFDKNGKLIKSDYYSADAAVNYPSELPTAVGYGQATGWSSNPAAAGMDDLAIVAVYNEPAEEHAITVTNGTGTASYKYNERATVTAPATDGAQVFSHWTRNGKVASYSPEYSFYVWDAATLTAHYTYEASDSVPGIVLEDVVKTIGDNRYFMAERFGFNDEEIIESGMLYGKGAELDIDSYDAKVCSISNNTQFLSSTSDSLYKVRAYVIYRDGENKIRIAYSDMK